MNYSVFIHGNTWHYFTAVTSKVPNFPHIFASYSKYTVHSKTTLSTSNVTYQTTTFHNHSLCSDFIEKTGSSNVFFFFLLDFFTNIFKLKTNQKHLIQNIESILSGLNPNVYYRSLRHTSWQSIRFRNPLNYLGISEYIT